MAEPNTLRVVFMGTPAFAVPVLEALANADFIEVALVVTRPDAASGRGKALIPSEVKACAMQLGIPVLETKTLRTPEVQQALAQVGADAFCVAAYGAIIPPEVIAMPPLGCLNVHGSLLPRGRGAAPLQRGLLEGEGRLGYSIMQIEEGLDTGPYCAQGSIEVGELLFDEVAAQVATLGAASLVEVLRAMAAGQAPQWTAQDDALSTYAAKISKPEVMLDPAAPALQNMRRVQASSDAAPARCTIAGRPLRVVRAHVLTAEERAALPEAARVLEPGAAYVAKSCVALACADGGLLQVAQVKPDGKRAMEAREFAAGVKDSITTWEAL